MHILEKHRALVTTLVLSFVLFMFLAFLAKGGYVHASDLWLYERVQTLWNPASILVASSVTHIFSFPAVLVLVLVCGAMLLIRRRPDVVVVLLGASVLGYATEFFTKALLRIPRPPLAVVDVSSQWSFPSGHTIAATILLGALIYALGRSSFSSPRRRILGGLAILGILAVALSRVFLGAHWLSDIVAGGSAGVFWIAFFVLAVQLLPSHITRMWHLWERAVAPIVKER